MGKKLNDQNQRPSDIKVNDQPDQNDATSSQDLLEIKVPEVEEEVEVDKSTIQRKPQFRFSENNKRRF